MSKYFGTDGFRGEANVGLTVEHAYRIGRFLGWYYGREHKCSVVIGKDTRRSSYMFENALSAGLTASGADAYLMHVTTTPSVSYIVRSDDFDCGIMISASHNPFCDNGIKLVNSDGFKMDEDVLELIEDYVDGKSEVPLATGNHIGATVDYMQGRNRYIASLIASANFSLQGVKIGIDCANGSASSVAKPVFDALGADVRVINAAPDGFNINVDCGSTHMERLQRHVVEQGLDVGFAYDGDADRCLCVDEKGNVVTGDHILYIYGKYMKERGKLLGNTVVTTIMSNFGLYKAFDELGIGYELHEAPYDEADLSATAMARSLGVPVEEVFKTLVVRGDNEDIKSFEDLKGKKTTNSIASTYMILAEEFGAEVVGVDTLDQTIMQVLTGRADATLNSEVSIADYMQKRPDANIKIVALTEEANLVAIPTRKTDDSASLLEAINQAIAELREEGKLSEISMKYFGRDITAETVGEAAE